MTFFVRTGTSTLVSSHPELLDGSFDDSVPREVCRKDTGQGKKLRKWSRGHQFIVRGGGHIDSWQPLYRYVQNKILCTVPYLTLTSTHSSAHACTETV